MILLRVGVLRYFVLLHWSEETVCQGESDAIRAASDKRKPLHAAAIMILSRALLAFGTLNVYLNNFLVVYCPGFSRRISGSTIMQGRGKREIPEKTRRPKASSGTIPEARPGIEPGSPWWEASKLTAQPPWPLLMTNCRTKILRTREPMSKFRAKDLSLKYLSGVALEASQLENIRLQNRTAQLNLRQDSQRPVASVRPSITFESRTRQDEWHCTLRKQYRASVSQPEITLYFNSPTVRVLRIVFICVVMFASNRVLVQACLGSSDGEIGEYGAAPECKGLENGRSSRKPADQRRREARFPYATIREWPRRETSPSKYGNRIRLEIAKQSSNSHKAPYDRVKRCRERKINIKVSERVNVGVCTQNKRPTLLRESPLEVAACARADDVRRWRRESRVLAASVSSTEPTPYEVVSFAPFCSESVVHRKFARVHCALRSCTAWPENGAALLVLRRYFVACVIDCFIRQVRLSQWEIVNKLELINDDNNNGKERLSSSSEADLINPTTKRSYLFADRLCEAVGKGLVSDWLLSLAKYSLLAVLPPGFGIVSFTFRVDMPPKRNKPGRFYTSESLKKPFRLVKDELNTTLAKIGKSFFMSPEIELKVVNYITTMQSLGFGRTVNRVSEGLETFFFLKPGKDTVSPATFSLTNAVSATVAENILFLHAMSGCDTSVLSMQGEIKFLKTLVKNSHVADVVILFKDSNATQEMAAAAGERFLVSLYGYSGANVPSLNHLRYSSYKKSAFRYSCFTIICNCSTGLKKNAEEWGWKKTNTGLEPVFTVLPPVTPALLKLKAGLCCSNTCLNCEGSCNNIAVVSQDEEDELDLETELEMDYPPIEPVDPMDEEQALPQDDLRIQRWNNLLKALFSESENSCEARKQLL
ncbi:hypothetical protein PR048_019799 [Dryococelus australis]|uniref:Uncharacterized protein n=1 Tax=Dryococelus australis TaxID=614101 RepID=A0ABQ9H4I3_9NEOP|nr:hypothetical protein PR048_019799 [Dryococelus australis]